MYELDRYINTTIGGLRISKRKKEELAVEFKDHLESLKSEFLKDGFSEGEAIQRAIEIFGESSDIKKKLHKSLLSFRNTGNVILGLVIALIIIIFIYLPTAGAIIAFRDYSSAFDVRYLFFTSKWSVINCILFFIPIGYFLPIILNRVCNALQWALTFSTLGILIGVCFSITLTNSVNVKLLLMYFVLELLGGSAGYVMLIVVNKLNMVLRNKRIAKFPTF